MIADIANAGVMDVIKSVATGGSALWYGLATVVFLFLMKKIPNDKIQAVIGKLFYGLGCTVTLGLSTWKWSAPVWQKTIEPYFVDLVENVVNTALNKFVEGIRSDNDA